MSHAVRGWPFSPHFHASVPNKRRQPRTSLDADHIPVSHDPSVPTDDRDSIPLLVAPSVLFLPAESVSPSIGPQLAFPIRPVESPPHVLNRPRSLSTTPFFSRRPPCVVETTSLAAYFIVPSYPGVVNRSCREGPSNHIRSVPPRLRSGNGFYRSAAGQFLPVGDAMFAEEQ